MNNISQFSYRAGHHFIKFIRRLLYYFYQDLKLGRARGVLLIGIGNLLPDLLSFSYVRSFIWMLAGVRMSEYSSTTIRAGVFTEYPRNLRLGKNCHINRNTYLDTNGPISIGDYVSISLNCQLLTISHEGIKHEVDEIGGIIIKNFCSVYAGSIILPGAILEEGVILSAHSVLGGDTEPWSVYSGNPAKLIRRRNMNPNNLLD
jgi:putative colanic acid biosynthesis acetyltransferase WcaF